MAAVNNIVGNATLCGIYGSKKTANCRFELCFHYALVVEILFYCIYSFVYLFIFIYLFIYLFIYIFIYLFIYLFIYSLMLTMTEQILFAIKNSNKRLIDVNTLVKKPIKHETFYVKT